MKKSSIEALKVINEKIENGIEGLLKVSFKNDENFDEAKVKKILQLLDTKTAAATGSKKGPAAAAPAKKDFRAFLKQQKMQAKQKEDLSKDATDSKEEMAENFF